MNAITIFAFVINHHRLSEPATAGAKPAEACPDTMAVRDILLVVSLCLLVVVPASAVAASYDATFALTMVHYSAAACACHVAARRTWASAHLFVHRLPCNNFAKLDLSVQLDSRLQCPGGVQQELARLRGL